MKMPTITPILAVLLAANGAQAQNIGDQFRCPGPQDLPDVLATVGETSLLSELLGEPVATETTILHMQLIGDGEDLPLVPHAPFDAAAVAECATETAVPFDRAAFATGFDAFQAEIRADEAGLFQIPPAEAFWLTIGGLSDGG